MKKIALFMIIVLVLSLVPLAVGARENSYSKYIMQKEDSTRGEMLPAFDGSKRKGKPLPAYDETKDNEATGYGVIYAPLREREVDDAPVIIDKYYEPTPVSEGEMFKVYVEVTDDVGLKEFKIKFDDGTVLSKTVAQADCNNDKTFCRAWFEREDSAGSHSYNLYAFDSSDNMAFAIIGIKVQSPGHNPPLIVDKFTVPGEVKAGEDFEVVYVVEDDYKLKSFKIIYDDNTEDEKDNSECEQDDFCTVRFVRKDTEGLHKYKLFAYDNYDNWAYASIEVNVGCMDLDNDLVCDKDEKDECVGQNSENFPESEVCQNYVLEEGCHELVNDDGSSVCDESLSLQCSEEDDNVYNVKIQKHCGIETGSCDGVDVATFEDMFDDCTANEICVEDSCVPKCDDDDNDGVCNEYDQCPGENQENMPTGNECIVYSFDDVNGCHEVDVKDYGFEIQEIDCSYLNTDCKDYGNSFDICDGEGGIVYGSCNKFYNDDGSTICSEWEDYECPFGSLPGQNVFQQTVVQYCGENTGVCNGNIDYLEDYMLTDECLDTEKCVNNNDECQELSCDDQDNDGVCDYNDQCIGENQANLPPNKECSYYTFKEETGCHVENHSSQGTVVGFTQCGYLSSECKNYTRIPYKNVRTS